MQRSVSLFFRSFVVWEGASVRLFGELLQQFDLFRRVQIGVLEIAQGAGAGFQRVQKSEHREKTGFFGVQDVLQKRKSVVVTVLKHPTFRLNDTAIDRGKNQTGVKQNVGFRAFFSVQKGQCPQIGEELHRDAGRIKAGCIQNFCG